MIARLADDRGTVLGGARADRARADRARPGGGGSTVTIGRRLAARLVARVRDDAGSAIVEFIFVAIVMLVPLAYFIAAVAQVQRSQLAVSQAARNAGRAFATADTNAQARARAGAAVRLALESQGLPSDVAPRYVPAGAGCAAAPITPQLQPGAEFTICVVRRADIPGVPSVLEGRGIVTTSVYVVHVDDYRSAPR